MRVLKLYILLTVLTWTAISAAAQEVRDSVAVEDNDTVRYRIVYVHDTVYTAQPNVEESHAGDLMRIKAVGRFDRGMVNYRFIPRGKWIGGVTASYADLDIDDNQLLYSLLKDVSLSGRIISVKPYIGLAVKDNIVLGLKFGYSHGIAEIGNLAINYDDLDISLKNLRYTDDSYSVALFHRSYVGIDKGKRFGVFNETTLSFVSGSTSFQREEEENGLKRTDTDVLEARLGINPGVAVFIMDNVSAEISFGVAGLKYRYEKQNNNLGETGKRHNSGADFKINLFNINIGITLCM
jgi:hypothetical protein